MKFILIVMLRVYGGYTMSFQEFDNQTACQRAMEEIQKFDFYQKQLLKPQMKCVAKE